MATFDEALTACTSEMLPSPSVDAGDDTLDPEFEKSLDLSDQIRSGKIKAADAVRSFRKRFSSKNGNVILRTLLTLDTCIKNSGDAFLKEVAGVSTATLWTSSFGTIVGAGASASIVQDIENTIKLTSNADVRQTTLRLLQNWAIAFQSKPSLSISELVLMYTRLKNEGVYRFPPVSKAATAAMIDSISAPSWTADAMQDRCERCRDSFTLTNRRHHCRNCGGLFDGKCSSLTLPLPHFGIKENVRVCDGCYKKIKSGQIPSSSSDTSTLNSLPGNPLYPRYSAGSAFSVGATPPQNARSQEEDDIQRAIRLSLQEQGSSRGGRTHEDDLKGPPRSSGYRPSYESRSQQHAGEEDDPDLAAAIAASLRDMEAAPSAPPEVMEPNYAQAQAGSADQASQASSNTHPVYKPLPSVELSDSTLDNLLTFSQTAKMHQTAPQMLAQQFQDVIGTIGSMQERAELSRKDLIRSVRDSAGREQVLLETKDKLREIMRVYERLLERQVASHQPLSQRQDIYAYPSVEVNRTPSAQINRSQSHTSAHSQASAYPQLPVQYGNNVSDNQEAFHRASSQHYVSPNAPYPQSHSLGSHEALPQQHQQLAQYSQQQEQEHGYQHQQQPVYQEQPRYGEEMPQMQPHANFEHSYHAGSQSQPYQHIPQQYDSGSYLNAQAPPFSPSMQQTQPMYPADSSQDIVHVRHDQTLPPTHDPVPASPSQQYLTQQYAQNAHPHAQRHHSSMQPPSQQQQQAQQLASLPHAPSTPLYTHGQFPQVPANDFVPERRQQEASLIDL